MFCTVVELTLRFAPPNTAMPEWMLPQLLDPGPAMVNPDIVTEAPALTTSTTFLSPLSDAGWMIELPLPARVRLLGTVTCSGYFPSQTTIVSPAVLALTALWIVL
jgi:hypothetical protein